MGHLLRSELRRFRTMTLAFAIGHLLVLSAVATGEALFTPSRTKLAVALLGYSLAGLLLGLYQFRTYRRPNLWTFLLHRPMAPSRIFFALAGGGALTLLLVVAVPLLSITLFLDHVSWPWIDLRHYGMTPFAFGIALATYLAGAFIALSPHRGAFLVLVLPLLFLSPGASGWWAFAAQAIVIAWLGYLAHAAFKPNLDEPLRRPLAVVTCALPLQYAFFWALMMAGAFLYATLVAFQEHGWRSFAVHTWNEYFPEGSFARTEYLFGAEALLHGLSLADSPRARELAESVDAEGVVHLAPRRWAPPTPHQPLFLDHGAVLYDEYHEIDWIFSHDRMLFQGRYTHNRTSAGWLGPYGTSPMPEDLKPFDEVPVVERETQLLTRRRVYDFDPPRRRAHLRFEADEGETLLTPLIEHSKVEHSGAEGGTFYSLLTDRALYLLIPRSGNPAGSLKRLASLPLPGEVEDLAKVAATRLDGESGKYLASFVFGTRSERGLGPARQVVVVTAIDSGAPPISRYRPGGSAPAPYPPSKSPGGSEVEVKVEVKVEVVADVPLTQGPPEWMRHWGTVISPALRHLHDALWGAVNPRSRQRVGLGDVLRRPPPRSILLWALVVAITSASTTAWLARRRRLAAPQRHAWTAAAALTGLPGLLSFLILAPRRAPPA